MIAHNSLSPVSRPQESGGASNLQAELGQTVFGQADDEFQVPEIMDAVLSCISNEYTRVYWNAKQENCPSPFANSGSRLNTPTFQAHAYSWGDDDQPWNFSWRDLRIRWYKWAGRGMSSNIPITPEMAAQCLDECLAEIRHMEDGETFDHVYPNFIDLE